MPSTLRGADIVARVLERAGHTDIFTLSGNHIMSLFDAAIETKLSLMHVRHEAAAVHMADAYGRLTGRPGVAWVTGGPGHANAVGALFTALGQETPMVLMSGHTDIAQLGRGGFQELRQVDMAAPVCKAAWMATDTATVGLDVAKALRLSMTGRPGPVHLSLPSDVLDAVVDDTSVAWPSVEDLSVAVVPLSEAASDAILALLTTAKRPLIIGAPVLATAKGRALLRRLEAALGIPACISEGPRGFNDASLGAYTDVATRVDMVLLLGKALDFTLKFGGDPFPADCRFISIDADGVMLDRAARSRGLAFGCVADIYPAAELLIKRATRRHDAAWLADARSCFDDRPTEWSHLASRTPELLHPAQVFRADL